MDELRYLFSPLTALGVDWPKLDTMDEVFSKDLVAFWVSFAKHG